MDKIEELLTRGVANIIPNKEDLEKILRSGKKLNIYLGIDPTATRIHLGHAVPLRKLQAFAELGHNVTFLIGDFTALIGDTSDKDSERPVLTSTEIEKNFQTYKKQAEKILDFSKVQVKFNSEWLQKLNFTEIVKLCQQFSFGDFASRELIRKRLEKGGKVGMHEALYPAMQGYDSYHLDTDIQIGGTDQTFNMQAGRILQKKWRNKESFVMTNVFLEGTDGRKMSKTWDNAIWLEDDPSDMYTKVMSVRDDLIIEYYTLATDLPLNIINEVKDRLDGGENPMPIKKELAKQIVAELHSPKQAEEAEESFTKIVQQKAVPTDIPSFTLPKELASNATITDVLVKSGLVSSKSDAKRVVEQGGTSVDSKTVTNPNAPFEPKDGQIIKVGKHRFIKIKTAD